MLNLGKGFDEEKDIALIQSFSLNLLLVARGKNNQIVIT
jgi:hypothetical protein